MKAPKLHQGDQIAIISPSNPVANRKDEVAKARANFEKATGLKTVLSPNALGQHFYSSGTAEERTNDFHWALSNPDFKAIIFMVGGNTAIDLVEGLNYDLIKQNPKIISGISDATTLLDAITAKTGLITFLGLEFLDYATEPMKYETEAIKKAWFDGDIDDIKPNTNWRDFDALPTTYKGWETIREGKSEGVIAGGNFTCFSQLFGTDYYQDPAGSLLTIETYKLSKREVHRMLMQLRLRGVFDKISGLIIGYCLGSDDIETVGNDRSLKDVVLETTEDYDFPILWIGEVGHNVENIMLPIGAKASLDSTKKTFTILETVTE